MSRFEDNCLGSFETQILSGVGRRKIRIGYGEKNWILKIKK